MAGIAAMLALLPALMAGTLMLVLSCSGAAPPEASSASPPAACSASDFAAEAVCLNRCLAGTTDFVLYRGDGIQCMVPCDAALGTLKGY